MKVSRETFRAIKAKAAARKARRGARRVENMALEGVQNAQNGPRRPLKVKNGQPRTKRRKVPARKRAFQRLKAACKGFVFARNADLGAGMCEIALACGGAERADTWYHGWPQKGGNGLKYDPRSHFASCGRCNMGEYGARYRGTPEYVNRHRQLLGPEMFKTLEALHGRRQIVTAEAVRLAEEIEAATKSMAWRTA